MGIFNQCAIALCLLAGQTVLAQTFQKGDIVADVNLGIGIARTSESSFNNNDKFDNEKVNKIIFTQRIGLEFGVCNFSDKASLGVGFSFINGVFSANSLVGGKYNYDYEINRYHRITNHNRNVWECYQTEMVNRNGVGTALAKATYDDLSLMARVAFHYKFIDRLDAYAGLGFGIARLNNNYSDFSHEEGFSSGHRTLNRENKTDRYQFVYDYNDLDHVEWDGGNTASRFAVAAYIGARYYIADHYGVNVEIGLPALTLKKRFNNYDILSVGFSYKF